MVTKVAFSPKYFGFFKKWTKKCPKLKTQNTFGTKKSLKYNKFPKQLKEKYTKIQKNFYSFYKSLYIMKNGFIFYFNIMTWSIIVMSINYYYIHIFII